MLSVRNTFPLLVFTSVARAATTNLNWSRSVGNQGTTTISAGDTVVWTWTESGSTHTVNSDDGGFTSSSSQSSLGFQYSVTFPNAGSFGYFCQFHTSMKGVIAVVALTPTPTLQPTSLPPTISPTLAPVQPDEPTAEPTSAAPSALPTFSPTALPTTALPTAIPTSAPTYDLSALLQKALTYPEVLSSGSSTPSSWNRTLYVREHRVVDDEVEFNTRAYCYEESGSGTNIVCSHPGPTIKVLPGDNFTLTIVNELGPDSATAAHVHNTFHSPNTTNVHTHGLHIDPKVDTVFVKAASGESLTYAYQIPETHAPGLHWYHAHYHGSSTLQLMGGLAGALIVEPNAISSVDNIPASIKTADSHVLAVTRLVFVQDTSDGVVSQGCGNGWACDAISQAPLCTGSETTSPYNAFRVYTYPELASAAGSTMDINARFTSGTAKDVDLVNGQYQPTTVLHQNSPSIFRVLHAAGGGPMALTMSSSSACSMSVIAWDGIYLDARLDQSTVNMPAASRMDMEVSCSEAGVFFLQGNGDALVTLLVNATTTGSAFTPKSSVTDAELAAIVRPWYLQDLTDAADISVDSFYSVHVNQESRNDSICGFWIGARRNCCDVQPWGPNLPQADDAQCPFRQFDGQRGVTTAPYLALNKLVTFVGAINEWTFFGQGSAFHPLHIHVNHFQVVSTSSSEDSDGYYRVGQWRDTLPPVAQKATFRFRTADFTGETVMHCHFQRHEDVGMMDTYLVVTPEEFATLSAAPTAQPTISFTPTATPTVDPASSAGTSTSSSSSSSGTTATIIIVVVVIVVLVLALAGAAYVFLRGDCRESQVSPTKPPNPKAYGAIRS